MTVNLALRWLTGGVLVAIAIWEAAQLVRHRDDLALRVLASGLVLLAIAATIGIPTPALAPIQLFFGSWWTVLINGFWMTMAYCFAAYFVVANDDRPMRVRKQQALLEFGILMTALATLIVVYQTAPVGTWHHPRLPEDYRTWRNTVFYLSVDGYSLAVWLIGVRRAGRYLRRLEHPWARAALLLVVTGSAALALGVDGVSLVRQVIGALFPQYEAHVFTVVYSTGQLGGQLLIALGLILAPMANATVAVWSRYDRVLRARYCRKLMPLWRLLAAEFPNIVLRAQGDHHAQLDRSGEDEFENITDEITDGLSELARDCPKHTVDMRDLAVAADIVAAGFAQRAANRSARWASEDTQQPDPPYAWIEPEFHGSWRCRAQWMIGLGNELKKRGMIPQKDTEDAPLVAG
ncbi:MAG: MAB_1171c family putative transporter [Sciscionella sp.]